MNFDSEIERIFWERFPIYADERFRLLPQYPVETPIGGFRIDFVAERTNPETRVGFECDGKDFHHAKNRATDARRDRAILEAGTIDQIFRLRGKDLYYRIEDTLHLLSSVSPWLFSQRGRQALEQLSSPPYRRVDEIGQIAGDFPNIARRDYHYDEEWLERYRDSLEDEDPEQEERMPPTIIYWTNSPSRPSVIH